MNLKPFARLAATLTLILLAACTAPTITPDHTAALALAKLQLGIEVAA